MRRTGEIIAYKPPLILKKKFIEVGAKQMGAVVEAAPLWTR